MKNVKTEILQASMAVAASDKPHKSPMGAFLAKAVCWTCGVAALVAVASCGVPAPSETLSSTGTSRRR